MTEMTVRVPMVDVVVTRRAKTDRLEGFIPGVGPGVGVNEAQPIGVHGPKTHVVIYITPWDGVGRHQ